MRRLILGLALAAACAALLPGAIVAAAPAPELLGVTWNLTTLQAAGQPLETVGGAGLTITFGADGRVGGSGGCNQFSGTFTADTLPSGMGGTLSFSPLAATRRACADDAATARETRYFATLQEATGYVIDANGLRLTFAQGDRQLAYARAAGGGGGTAQVTGTVTYLQRIALPPTAVLTVQLLDTSRVDAPSITVSEQRIVTGGAAPPYAFTLPYDPAQIVMTNTYAVRARIEVDGQLRFTSTQAYLVITQGRPSSGVAIVVDAVGGEPTLPNSGGGGSAASGFLAPWSLALLLGGALLLLGRRRVSRAAGRG